MTSGHFGLLFKTKGDPFTKIEFHSGRTGIPICRDVDNSPAVNTIFLAEKQSVIFEKLSLDVFSAACFIYVHVCLCSKLFGKILEMLRVIDELRIISKNHRRIV